MTLQPEAGSAPVDGLWIGTGEITFGETQIIKRIQQVGLADTVVPANADDPLGKRKAGFRIVLKL